MKLIEQLIQVIPSNVCVDNYLNHSAKQDLCDLLLQDNIIITSELRITIGLRLKKTIH
jgi:hypothetical protein